MANPQKVQSEVINIEKFGLGVYSVTFRVPERYTKFLPGQFLHLTLDEFDATTGFWPESRVFSISSQPRKDTVSIVYSVKGRYTQLMEKELTVGRAVWLKLPYGSFIIGGDQNEAAVKVLIAGGTGVSPYLPFLLGTGQYSGTVHLYYGIGHPEHFLLRDIWKQLMLKPWLNTHVYLENGQLEGVNHQKGRLDIHQILESLGDQKGLSDFYISGPPAMIHSFSQELEEQKVEKSKIFVDEWE